MLRNQGLKMLHVSIGLVWLINGAWAKLLHMVPRHEQIVAGILGQSFANELTTSIGIAEIGMAIWVWSRKWVRWCTWLQVTAVVLMNILEALLVPHLLLFGYGNLVLASLFVFAVWYDGTIHVKQSERNYAAG